MGYYIDLSGISIDQYKSTLETADLLPSQMILKDNIGEIFGRIKMQEIESVEELRKALGSKKKLQGFSQQSGISEDYLRILIRNVNSYRQKPSNIKDFPDVSDDTLLKLKGSGIKNTLQLYDKILTPQSRHELSSQTGIGESDLVRLAKLADLCRIRWVSHTFAYVLLEAGYDTAEQVANADYNQLYGQVRKLNEERAIFRGHIGLHDMKLCVEAARELPFEIEV
jgi:hypothetical protein